MSQSSWWMRSLALCACLFAGCDDDADARDGGASAVEGVEERFSDLSRDLAPAVPSADLEALTRGQTDFAFDLYRFFTCPDRTFPVVQP